jgi:1-acyl-sn-glycerol-3-phosphate acyltransferase
MQKVLENPEGTRSRTGKLLPFHPGPAILSLGQRVPVLPLHIDGAANILRPGTRESQPAPVHVRVGPAVSFDEGVDVAEATQAIHDAVQALVPARRVEPVVA